MEEEYLVIQLENGFFLRWEFVFDIHQGMVLKSSGYQFPNYATRVDKTCLNQDTLAKIQNKFPGARIVKVQATYTILEEYAKVPWTYEHEQ